SQRGLQDHNRREFDEFVSAFDHILGHLNQNEFIIEPPALVKRSFLKGLSPQVWERVQWEQFASRVGGHLMVERGKSGSRLAWMWEYWGGGFRRESKSSQFSTAAGSFYCCEKPTLCHIRCGKKNRLSR
ncbi:hypothetical protein VP01_7621g1, partial [Puccinia sorghi]